MKRVVIFSPYGLWTVHSQVDAVIGSALHSRGCEVVAVCCDGIFEDCPVAKNKKEVCQRCSMQSKYLFSSFKIPVLFLKSMITEELVLQLKDWTQSIPVESLKNIKFRENEVGKWITPSTFSYFVTGVSDFSDPNYVKIYRSFILNAAILINSFGTFLDVFKPNHFICYSGVHCYYKIALELATQKNINTLIHERGTIDDSFTFIDSGGIVSYQNRLDFFENWKNIPLNFEELEWVKEYIQNREKGKNINWHSPYSYSSDANLTYKVLRIPAGSKIISLFTSHNWEYGMLALESYIAFNSQIEAIKHICLSLKDTNHYIIVRFHPSMGHSVLLNKEFFDDFFQQLYYDLPQNVRVVMPNEKLTSYSLLWNSDAVITFGSTVGLEANFKGSSHITHAKNLYNTVSKPVKDVNNYIKIVEEAIHKTENFMIDDLKLAYRATYYSFNRVNFRFKTFGIKNFHRAHIRVKNAKDLEEGYDPSLDQVCNHIMHGTQIYRLPNEQELHRNEEIENKFLSKELESIRRKRTEIKKQVFMNSYKEPRVSVFIIAQAPIEPEQSSFFKSLKRSRHKNIKTEIVICDYRNSKTFLKKLKEIINQSTDNYIYLASSNIHIDESLFSSTIDFLEKTENVTYAASVCGAFICNNNYQLDSLLFTSDPDDKGDQEDYCYLKESIQFYEKNPQQLLSLFIWRKTALIKFLSDLIKEKNVIDLTEIIFEKVFSKKPIIQVFKSSIPNLIIFPYQEESVAMSPDQSFLEKSKDLHFKEIMMNKDKKQTPLISVIRIRDNGLIQPTNTYLYNSIHSSSYQNYEMLPNSEVAYPSFSHNKLLLGELAISISRSKGRYIYISTDNVHIDELLFSFTMNMLENNENTTYKAMLFGLTICDNNKNIMGQLFTDRNTISNNEQVKKISCSVHNPALLLSLFIWEKNCIAELIAEVKCEYKSDTIDLSEFLFEKIFSIKWRSRIYQSFKPYVTIYKQKPIEQLSVEKHSSEYLRIDEVFHFIDSVPGFLVKGQEKYLFEKVKSLPENARILEIGSCYGRSASTMAFACVGTNKKIISIDTFLGNTDGGTRKEGNTFLDVWYNNIKRLKLNRYIQLLVGYSHDVIPTLDQQIKFDFVFVDASHHYKDIIKELELIYPLVAVGGWIAFHDVSPDWPGPWRVWRESARVLLTSHEYCSTISCGQKTVNNTFTAPENEHYSFSKEWATYLKDILPQVSNAMIISMDISHPMFEQANNAIASLPEKFVNMLNNMLKLEAKNDPILHYWKALLLEKEGQINKAIEALEFAIKIPISSNSLLISHKLNTLKLKQ